MRLLKSAALGAAMLALAACAPITILIDTPNVPPKTSPRPTVEPSTPPSGTPTTPRPTATPSAGPSWHPPTWTPYPSPSPSWYQPTYTPYPEGSYPPPGGKIVIISGNVYDEEGAVVDGALVQVRSLDASVPYTATATTSSGSYVVNNVPEGANMEIVATKDGWTTRRRVGSFQYEPDMRNTIDFGAAGDEDGGSSYGAAYFISDYPEVERTEPFSDATGVDPGKVYYQLTLSEPLDDSNRARFADALRLFPVTDALGNLEDREDTGLAGELKVDGVLTQALSTESAFNRERAQLAWNAEGTVATFTYAGPLSRETGYQVALVVADDDAIEDTDGNALGTSGSYELGSQSPLGHLILGVFRENDLSLNTIPNVGIADARWATTHDNLSHFETR